MKGYIAELEQIPKICNVCFSLKTYVATVNGKRYPRWTRNEDGFICQKCYLKRYFALWDRRHKPSLDIQSSPPRPKNPPNEVYRDNSWCSRCREVFTKDTRLCPNCRTLVRHGSRHSKKNIKRY